MPDRRVLLLLAPVLLAGCRYAFDNPAGTLQAGQATGVVLADRTATGALDPFPGVSVSLKGAAYDQTTHESGRFVLLELPAGRHTLLFRKGTSWSLERDVEIAFGSDGQPEGVDLGQVVLRYAAAVEGTFTILPGNTITGGVVVDERSGQTAALLPRAFPEANQATFRFPALGVGPHLLKVGAVDGFGGRWVGGQAPVTVAESNQAQVIPVSPGALAARVASSTGRVRFRVQEVGNTTANLALVTAALVDGAVTLGPFAPDSQGFVDQDVPEGAWQIVLSGGGLPIASRVGVTSRLLAAVPGAPLGPPTATAVALAGQVAEVGSIYVVSDIPALSSRLACLAPADCGGSGCQLGFCKDYTPPGSGNAGAGLAFCAPCTFNDATGGATCPVFGGKRATCACPVSDPLGQLCPSLPPTASACNPGCGTVCTTDGVATLGARPGPTGCVVP